MLTQPVQLALLLQAHVAGRVAVWHVPVGDNRHHQTQVAGANIRRRGALQVKRRRYLSPVVAVLVFIPPLRIVKPRVCRPTVTLGVGQAVAENAVVGAQYLVYPARCLEVKHFLARFLHVAQRLGEADHPQAGVVLCYLLTGPLVDALPPGRVQELGVGADAAGVVKQTEPVVGQHTVEPNHLVMPGLPGHDQLAGEGCRLRHPRRAEVVVQRVWLRIHEVRLPAS